jgi:para-aminobenzoate synthetase component I
LRRKKKFEGIYHKDLLKKSLAWAQSFKVSVLLNNNQIPYPHEPFQPILAAGTIDFISFKAGKAFESLKDFSNLKKDYLFGFFSYDLKNEVEDLSTLKEDLLEFPDLYFFQPAHLIFFNEDHIIIESVDDPEKIYKEIIAFEIRVTNSKTGCDLKQNLSKEEYLKKVSILRDHLAEGDIYEINFCIEFFAENTLIDSLDLYFQLNQKSPMPFSAFFRLEDKYLLCASPERFLKKDKNLLISQPIKGTRKRGVSEEEDLYLKSELMNSQKEISENMMVVDLVRNDLARSCEPGSVKAEELFGIYTFKHVHQMISTIVGKKREKIHFIDTIKNAFPMGSMTGAPKISAMQLIEKYEPSKRGLFSGAIGYITPESNFDFNVIIRSLLYNSTNKYLSFQAGSAITYEAEPEKEYEECLLKASVIREMLS